MTLRNTCRTAVRNLFSGGVTYLVVKVIDVESGK